MLRPLLLALPWILATLPPAAATDPCDAGLCVDLDEGDGSCVPDGSYEGERNDWGVSVAGALVVSHGCETDNAESHRTFLGAGATVEFPSYVLPPPDELAEPVVIDVYWREECLVWFPYCGCDIFVTAHEVRRDVPCAFGPPLLWQLAPLP